MGEVNAAEIAVATRPRARREQLLVLCGIAVAAILSQLAIYFAFPANWGPDGALYALVGANFFQRHPFDILLAYDRFWVHPVIALSFAKAFASGAAWPLLQQALFMLLLIPTFLVIRRSFGFFVAALVTFAIAVNQPFLATMRVWSSEGIFGLAIWAGALCCLRALQKQGYRSAMVAGLAAAALPMIRPTAEYWVIFFVAGAVLVGMKKRYVLALVIAFLLPTLIGLGVNKARYGFFGYTWKTGRMAFYRVWDQDNSFSPENGPNSRRLYDLMDSDWPEIREWNPETTAEYPTFEAMYRDSLKRTGYAYHYQMYYAFIYQVRSQMPNAEADKFMKAVAYEAFRKDFGLYVRNTVRFSLMNLGLTQDRARFFEEPQKAPAAAEADDMSPAPESRRPSQQQWRFRPRPPYGKDQSEWQRGYRKAWAELASLWPQAPAGAPASAIRWNNRLRLATPPQKVVIALALLAALTFLVKAFRKRTVQAVWVLVIACIVLSHPVAIALFYGALELHNLPMIPCELMLAVLGLACGVSIFRALQQRWEQEGGDAKEARRS